MNVLSVVRIAIRRLWKNKGLALAVSVGLVAAVALIGSVPLYTDAANFIALQKQLAYSESGLKRPPFAFMYRYIGAWHGPIEFEDYMRVGEYMARFVPGAIGLPMQLATQYVMTDNFSLFAASDLAYGGTRQPLGWVNLGFVEGIGEHVYLLDGELPADAPANADMIEVLVSQRLADQVGLQVGEEYIVFSSASAPSSRPVQFHVVISGVWAPIDEGDPFWFYSPRVLESSLLVSLATWQQHIAPAVKGDVYAALWYFVFDGDDVRSEDVPSLLGRIYYVNTSLHNLLPNVSLDVSPVEALEIYRWATFVMTILLYVFSVPILGLILYFIGMVAGLIVQRQQGEIAVLKSRGAGNLQVLGIYALEGTILGAIALAIGLPLGRSLASFMGNTVSFLRFGSHTSLPIGVTPKTVLITIAGMIVFLLAGLVPALRAARLTIVTYKQDRLRALEKPLWQRLFLDLFLLIPAGYGYYLLRARGGLGIIGGNSGDPFRDPFLFLVPTLAVVALSLASMRLFPLVMELLAWMTSHFTKSVPLVLAFRQVARASRQYMGALLLVVLTVSLAAFTASMARTFDQSLVDQTYYRYGADYRLVELGEPLMREEQEEDAQEASSTTSGMGWAFVPVSEHLQVEGVRAATRVGRYQVEARVGEKEIQGVFYGIDRLEFPKVAFFRQDFAPEPLGELMNRLANYAAVLVSPEFLSENQLAIGDTIELYVTSYDLGARVPFVIAGVVHYFPTYYPNDEENRYLFVGNLDYFFEQVGGMYPYDVWIRTAYPLDQERAMAEMRQRDIHVVRMEGSREAIAEERQKPERTGVFGILSAGFVATAVLTVLGFLLHSFIAFQKRYIEFGVLRAIGLSMRQLLAFLSIEQVLLILVGATIGTALGVLVSHLFIPFLQVGATKQASIPPFVVLIGWRDIFKLYLVFGVMLICTIGSMLWSLGHLKVFEAVKLGEAV